MTSNKDLIFAAVKAVAKLESLETKDKHVLAVRNNVVKYLLQDLRLLAHDFRISREEFLEALR